MFLYYYLYIAHTTVRQPTAILFNILLSISFCFQCLLVILKNALPILVFTDWQKGGLK